MSNAESPKVVESAAPIAGDSARTNPNIPTAVLKPRRTISSAWLLPILAMLFAAWLGWRAWSMRGVAITVQLEDGYGLKAGDDIRYRGISVGRIDAISLHSDLQGVLVTARLNAHSQQLARRGTRYWVVRPQLQLTRVEGLETLIGPRYLAALPTPQSEDQSHWQYHFIGLDQPPVVDLIQPGDLEIILHAQQRGGLRAGAPVTYRQTRIGTILSVGLSGDGGAVEARVHIQQPFAQLVRPNTRFWDVGGLQAKLGLTGLTVEVESTEALLSGGVALATPPVEHAGGDIVRTGHRFAVAAEPDAEWQQWQPMVAIGSSLLPPGVYPPSPMRATIGWKQGRWIKGQRTNQGWVLQTSEGLLGPADLLQAGEKANADTVLLEVAGRTMPLNAAPAWERNGLALLAGSVGSAQWPASQQRVPNQPEDCLLIADFADNPTPLAASRLTARENRWHIDPAVPINPAWHGACVVSRADGKLLGILLANGQPAEVALLPPEHVASR